MTLDLRPWKRLVAVWLPAAVMFVAATSLFVWQTSESGGARARVRGEIAEFEAEFVRLAELEAATTSDREDVAILDEQFASLYSEVFGSREDRLTRILRAVGAATRSSGLRPGSYSYSANEDRSTGFIRFGVRFSVEGRYQQIRQMLAELQSSPEFLIVENLGLSGDEDPVRQELSISVSLATILTEADAEQLRRLTGGISTPAGAE